jgi:hypothetical protein
MIKRTTPEMAQLVKHKPKTRTRAHQAPKAKTPTPKKTKVTVPKKKRTTTAPKKKKPTGAPKKTNTAPKKKKTTGAPKTTIAAKKKKPTVPKKKTTIAAKKKKPTVPKKTTTAAPPKKAATHERLVIAVFTLADPSDKAKAKRMGFDSYGLLPAPPSLAPRIQAWLRKHSKGIHEHFLADPHSIVVRRTEKAGVFHVRYAALGPPPKGDRDRAEARMNDGFIVDPDDDGNYPITFHGMHVLIAGHPKN